MTADPRPWGRTSPWPRTDARASRAAPASDATATGHQARTAPLSPARKAAERLRSTARAGAPSRGWPRRGSEPLPASHAGPTPGAMATRHQHGTASPPLVPAREAECASRGTTRARKRRWAATAADDCPRLALAARVDPWRRRRRVPSSRGDVLPGSGRRGMHRATARTGAPPRARGPPWQWAAACVSRPATIPGTIVAGHRARAAALAAARGGRRGVHEAWHAGERRRGGRPPRLRTDAWGGRAY